MSSPETERTRVGGVAPPAPRTGDAWQLLQENRDAILELAARHGAKDVRVFGSAARGEATAGSDIDFLVSVSGETSPWFPSGLVADLQDLLGRRIDIVTEDGLYWLLRRRILREARPL